MKSLWRLTVKEEMPSAHALRNYNGKCENLHGHNFTIELVVDGYTLDESVEYLIDFTILKQILKDITATLDHKVINDIEYFTHKNPTSENIAQYIYREAKKRLMKYETVNVHSVTVAERSIQNVCYMELE